MWYQSEDSIVPVISNWARNVFCCTTLDLPVGCCCCCCCCCVMAGAECEGAMFLCLTREDAGGCCGTRNPSFFSTEPVDARRGMSAVAGIAATFGVSKLCCFIFCSNKPLCLCRCWLTVGWCCCGGCCWIGCCCIMPVAPSCSTGKPCNNVWKEQQEQFQLNGVPTTTVFERPQIFKGQKNSSIILNRKVAFIITSEH